ncbi:hypothetical protein G6O67_002004 [Ophiocordyceps sinensis]|uniref:Uncharacterized protein n=1 Tax=Ophiocordyceps sinensis TaxID=72228 RepID=A0A8H4PTB0_9HYPO|nr:hypothetical protein G6O67_002004 [Ophiocordyceps sinensis]
MTTTTWCAGGTVMGTNGVSSTTWTSPFSQPTRFETWVTKRESALESQELLHGGPRSERGSETPLPGNPNYPWGGDSPVHRHQNVTELSHGIMSGALEQSRRMSKVVGRLRAVLL